MAVDILLKIEGVEGESVISDHKGEIDVLSWSWGMSQSGSMHTGTGGGSGKVNVQDIIFTKKVDKSSPVLMKYCSTGKHFPSADLTVRKAGGDKPVNYLTIHMDMVIISMYQTGGSEGDDSVNESVGLNFRTYKLTYTPQNDDGTEGAAVEQAWNIAENVSM